MGAGASTNVDQKQNGSNANSNIVGDEKQRGGGAQFYVSLGSAEGFKFQSDIPPKFILRISYESLDFIKEDTFTPIIQFPFQNIVCWGSNSSMFRFHVFDFERMPTSPAPAPDEPQKNICIILKTAEGKLIEDTTMKTVQSLMVDIEKKAVSKEEFSSLVFAIFDESGQLKDDWLRSMDQFSTGRTFLAKQCMDLMLLIGPLAPFDKMDLACMLYTRILSKESFQLVVNTFEDVQERDNLIHRLGLKPSSQLQLVTDCKILPSAISSPKAKRTLKDMKAASPMTTASGTALTASALS